MDDKRDIIDCHGHAIPETYVAELKSRLGMNVLPRWSIDDQLAMMARYGISTAVVSLPPPGVYFGDDAACARLARSVNEAIASLSADHPGRFVGLSALPLPNVDAALEELRFALDELGLAGVALLTNVAGTHLGNPAFDPVFDELDRRSAYVFVHPQVPPYAAPLAAFPPWLAEFPFETTRAIINLIYTGTLERCPKVRMQFAHLGGTTPFLAGRLASLAEREPELAQKAPAGVHGYLRRLLIDTGLSNDVTPVKAAMDVVGTEHVLFGTDWPFAALPDGGDAAPGLDELGVVQRRLLEDGNPRAVIPGLRPSTEPGV